jgi:hypothetical protein
VVFRSEIRPVPKTKLQMGPKSANPALVAVSIRPCGPLALIPVNGKKKRNHGQNSDKNLLQRTPLGSQELEQATQQVFYMIRLSTRANRDRKNMTPQKTPKQKGLLMGFRALSPVQSPE